jgi:beta-galactosidase
MGKALHYYFNYSSNPVNVSYNYGAGANLLDGKSAAKGTSLALGPWDLAIIEETAQAH